MSMSTFGGPKHADLYGVVLELATSQVRKLEPNEKAQMGWLPVSVLSVIGRRVAPSALVLGGTRKPRVRTPTNPAAPAMELKPQ